ncbi:MAG TPA: elongation factor G [Alphaproteobacteria bacterium]|nr:elongation factor G [Alphaproteobacteria bacterium]
MASTSAMNGSGGAARARSVALVGPQGTGKSTLFEHMLAAAGSPFRRATEARDRAMGTEMTLGHCNFMGDPWSILDCPGSVEFQYEALAALAVVDMAVIVCEPSEERTLAVAPLLKLLEDQGTPHVVFVNKIDTLAGRVRDTMAALQVHSRRPMVLRQVPIRDKDGAVSGYVDVVSERAYRYRDGMPSELIELPADVKGREEEALAGLVEVLADHDDVLLEKIVEDLKPTPIEIYRQLHKDQASGAIVEVLMGSADRDNGVFRLWKALRHDCPDPAETAARKGIAPEGETLVQIFKTQHGSQAGKLSYGRVWRGSVQDGGTLAGIRVGGIFMMPGGSSQKATEARIGDLAAFGRLETAHTGSMLTASGTVPDATFPEPPEPVFALAIASADRKDEVKLSVALQKLVEEDPSLSLVHSAQTDETILQGQGEMHLNAAIERISRANKLTLHTAKPRVPFRETIRRKAKQHSRLKRQTGGHGQFADITIEIEPRRRGDGFCFVDKIVGGAIPRQYIPAVGEAAEDSMGKGPLGYPVVDVSVTLLDGTFHSVDSSDMAFKSVTRTAIHDGLEACEPFLLEPVDHVTISVPNDFTAAAQRIVTGRRGQILGFAERSGWPGWDDVEALVPEAELHDLIIDLRSRTMGVGSFRRRFDHMAEAPTRLLERVQQEANATARA